MLLYIYRPKPPFPSHFLVIQIKASTMVDPHAILCCMCGDVGFPDKLFHCTRCSSRFQHTYCSNYYNESTDESAIRFCDWCQSEQQSMRHGAHSRRPVAKDAGAVGRSRYVGDKIKQTDREESSDRGKNSGGSTPSPRQPGRRYKLLKDVLC
ncbi:uncharacterized protein LOC131232736 [Magnolia sinica]|uniref:uncharacterized protein LOC131232736 n=1 Tax=Magnolia sinica TaxID=86752 RepID=UPI002657FE8A|nr:uncharacterized protein LOC131232736 [Magnolia sinica]